MADFNKALRPGESVRKTAGVSNRALLATAVVLALVVAAYWVAMSYLFGLGSDTGLNAAMAPYARMFLNVLTGILAIVALWTLFVAVLKSMFTLYGLTDSRVLRRSFLSVRGADLAHVQDVEVAQTVLGKLFGYGDVLVRTASTNGTLALRRVDNPHEWFREISGLRG